MLSHIDSIPVPSYSLTEESLSALLDSLQGHITRAARAMFYRVYSIDLTLEDLVQEANIAAWKAAQNYNPAKVTNSRSLRAYCLIRARGAIVDYVRRQFRQVQSTSLEEWEEGYGEDGRRRELEARPASQPLESSPETRAAILAALENLSERQRAAVMASYMIEDTRGYCAAPTDVQERLKLTRGSFDDARRQALKKLALVL